MKINNKLLLLVLIFISLSISIYSENSKAIKVIKNVNLVPMTAEVVIPNQTVIVEGSTIKQIVDAKVLIIPENAQVIEGNGKYLMPGLADMHAHYTSDYEKDTYFNLFLKNGVTTVRLFHSFPNDSVLVWQDQQKRNEFFGPTLFTCGLFYNGPEPTASAILTTKKNYDFIKIYGDLSKKEFVKIMEIARQEKVYAIGHIPFKVGLDRFIQEGMREIAHVGELDYELVDYSKFSFKRALFGKVIEEWVKEYYDTELTPQEYLLSKDHEMNEIVAKVKASGMFVNPTLVIPKIIQEQLFEKEKFLKRPELKYMLKSFMPEYLAGHNPYQIQVEGLAKKYAKKMKGDNGSKFIEVYRMTGNMFLRKLHEADVPILLSTDTPGMVVAIVPGYSVHEELQIYTENGFTPYEAIKTSTFNAGKAVFAMTGKNSIGTIEVNKQADFILTNKNPLEKVENIKDMQGIMVQGRWLDKVELESLEVILKSTLADVLRDNLLKGGSAESVRIKYLEIKADSLKYYSIVENPLNDLGYQLCGLKRFAEAIEVFKINTIEFPESWNAYDSLGEAYLKAGEKKLALENYKKSVELNPNSATGKSAIKKLEK